MSKTRKSVAIATAAASALTAVSILGAAGAAVASPTATNDDCTPGPGKVLYGCDYSGQNLRGADFAGANITDDHFNHADLQGANFVGASAPGAQFNGANLTGANLGKLQGPRTQWAGADLYDTNFYGATLSYARIVCDPSVGDPNLQQASFTLADFDGIVGSGIVGTPQSLPAGWHLRGGALVYS